MRRTDVGAFLPKRKLQLVVRHDAAGNFGSLVYRRAAKGCPETAISLDFSPAVVAIINLVGKNRGGLQAASDVFTVPLVDSYGGEHGVSRDVVGNYQLDRLSRHFRHVSLADPALALSC